MTRRCLLPLLAITPLLSAYSWQTTNGNIIRLDDDQLLSINLGGSSVNDAAIDAAEWWNDVYGAYDKLEYAEQDGSSCDHDDGYNAVEGNTWSTSSCIASASSSALAVTVYSYDSDGEMGETDVLFNANYGWTTSLSSAESGSDNFLQGVAAHEFGHVLGLGHEDDAAVLMNPYYSLAYEELHADDIAGHRYLYDSGNTQDNVAMSRWKAPVSSSSAASLIECDTSAEAGDSLYIEFTLENRGTSSESIDVGFYISSNDTISTSDQLVYEFETTLSAGRETLLYGSIPIPDDIEEGSWYVGAYADHTESISESTADDNAVVCQAPVTIRCYDNDGDGHDAAECGGDDCDDGDSSTHPGRSESCDGQDNDCDGQIDEGVLDTWYYDADDDGYGTSSSIEACDDEGSYRATRSGDCDDNDDEVNPGESEQCNDIDDDCDGQVDEGLDCDSEDADDDQDDDDPGVPGDNDDGEEADTDDSVDSTNRRGMAKGCNQGSTAPVGSLVLQLAMTSLAVRRRSPART